MDLYGALVRHVLFPAWESGIRRRPTLARLGELRQLERVSLAELEAWQRQELAALLRHAYRNVPFYRRRFDAAGARPEDIRGPADLARLPLLTREEARASASERTSTAPPLPAIRKTTGGTTGEPLVIRYDADSEYWRQAIKLRGFGWAGWRIGDRALHYWGEYTRKRSLRQSGKERLDRAIRREHYVDCTPRGERAMDQVVEVIRRIRPRAIFCYAQAGAELARHIHRTGARSWETIPVVCGAERVWPADRAALEQAFGPAVFESYGCRETMLIATECHEHAGLHIQMENLIVELIGPDGAPVAPGEVGEVVLTDLHNLGQPFIRYANGDLAVMASADACRCGRAHPRLASVEGRQTETLRDRDGHPVGGMVFNLAFSPMAEAVRQFQAVQHRDGSITIKVVPASGTSVSRDVIAQVERSCARYLPGVPVAFETVPDIPTTRSGKRRVVVVESPSPPARGPERAP
jgi:phenylacetate-CoA ligase